MNILIIGLGSIAQKHIHAIRQVHLDAIIYALRSSKDSEHIHNIKNIYSFDEIDFKIDFIIISNPTQLHEETIKKTLKTGCPLFIEKPVLSDTKNAEKLITGIKRKNIITYVACNLRFHPAIQFLKTHLAENQLTINEVNVYCGSFLPDWRPGRDFRKVYSANASMGGGVHLDLIHELDYCTWLFGKPNETVSVKRKVSSLKIDSIDAASYHLFYDHFTANITLNYFRRESKREIEIVTENGTIHADLIQCKVTNMKDNSILFRKEYEMKDTYSLQMKYFTDHIKQDLQPMNDFAEAVDVLKIALS